MSGASAGHRRVIIRVDGRVQGVTYRATARRMARSLGITAEPRNLEDGSVRIDASGPPDAIERFIAWCHEGPPAAGVSDVRVEESS